MKVVEDNVTDGTIKVSELSVGDVFYLVNINNYRIYYMKTFSSNSNRENSVNAVNLTSGFVVTVHGDARVHKCDDAVLHIDFSTKIPASNDY